MQAMAALPDSLMDPNWYPDLGATNHCTPDGHNFQEKQDFNGIDKIFMGNGKGLPIISVGSLSFSTISPSNRYLHLKNLLHVPKLTKNLISVSKLTANNNVFFEFHLTVCFVKDQCTGITFLKRQLRHGLYKFGDQPVCGQVWQRKSETRTHTKLFSRDSIPLKSHLLPI